MNTSTRLTAVALTSALFFAPAFAAAQSTGYSGWTRWGNNELSQKINALNPAAVLEFPIPVLFGVAPGDLTRNFGDARDGGTRTHEGLDIMGKRDTPVVSPTDAVVTRTGVGATEGNYVYTANPGGETFAYMHLSRIGEGVVAGTVLKRGDLVGYVGNTGNASGGATHLHFEVRKGGATDPYPRLTQEFSLAERIVYLTGVLEKNTDTTLPQTLVTNFRSVFTAARAQGISLLPQIAALFGDTTAPPAADPKIAQLLAQVQQLQAQLAALSGASAVFARDLQLGSTGADVKELQIYLNTHGYPVATAGAGSPGNETTYFGSATRAALARFQSAHDVAPAVGYFGPLTRAAFV